MIEFKDGTADTMMQPKREHRPFTYPLWPTSTPELRELRQRLLDAIETLPLRYRPIVLLRCDTQLSFREIGQALSIPETTVKTYFYRAKKQLRTLLGPELAYY